MQKPTKQNSLYLTIKQVYFDQIVAGIGNSIVFRSTKFRVFQTVFCSARKHNKELEHRRLFQVIMGVGNSGR